MSYESLVRVPTLDEIRATAMRVLEAFRLPVLAWTETSLPRAIVEFECEQLLDVHQSVATIGRMGVLEDAAGEALDLHAQDNYDESRQQAVASERDVTLRNALPTPRSWGVGTLVITSSTTTTVYRNTASVSLPAASGAVQGAVSVRVRADVAGGDGTPAASLVLATPMPGVSLTAADTFAVVGVDQESDESLRRRCRTKWSAITQTGPREAYEYWGRLSHPEITRVGVVSSPGAEGAFPDVIVIAATPAGAPSPAALTAFQAAILERAPLGVRVSAEPASTKPVVIGGTVSLQTAYRAAAEVEIANRLTAYFASAPIGAPVHHAVVIGLVQSVPGVVLAALTDVATGDPLTSDGEWSMSSTQVPVLTRVYTIQLV